MDTETSAATRDSGEGSRLDRFAWMKLRGFLLAVIVLILAALVLVPFLIGRRTDLLRDRRAEVVFPALDALQESQVAFTEQLAAVRGYQISRDTVFLARFRDAMSRESVVEEELTRLATILGPNALHAVEEFRARTLEWQERPKALLAGAITDDQMIGSLTLGQQRFEAALLAADEARSALNRAEVGLDDRIQSAMRLERLLTILLSFAALAVVLIMIWLTYRLHRATRQLEERAERLRVSEERFRLIAENLREMIWISDPAYTIQYYLSPAYEVIWGRSNEQARNNPRSFLEAVVPEDRERVEAALEGYARGDYAVEYRIARPDGEIRWISGRAYPVRDEHGSVFLVAGIAEDITAQKQVEHEREQLLERERLAHKETGAALHMRDRVLRVVSHDLKNPLHTIGMAAELLEMPLSEEQRAQQFAIIRRTIARANRMVLDLLDAARIQSGRAVAIDPEPLEVQPLLAEAVEAFRFQAKQKHQELTCDIADGVGSVLADHDRLLQALSNLLGNAVKFTPEGGRIGIRAEMEANDAVRFYVADSGPGIATDLLPHLFEPFTQARDTASLGTGLGLSIARGIVEAHRGAISVQSERGQGTTFTFNIPTPRASDHGSRPARRYDTEGTMADRRKQNADQPESDKKDSKAGSDDRKTAPPAPLAPRRPPSYPDPVDDTLDDSFPASDPPSWWGR